VEYGLTFAIIQVGLWLMLGFRLNPTFSVLGAFKIRYALYSTFIFFSFFPFAAGRLGLTRMMWFVLTGTLLGMGAYYALAFFEPARRLNHLLPFIAYLQLTFAGVSLGFLWEFGRWVFRKLKE